MQLCRKVYRGQAWLRKTIKRKIINWRTGDPVVAWFADRGDETIRLTLPVSADSTVFDLGGYKGQWASDVFAKYLCTVHVFEPVPEFAQLIRERFLRNPKIILHEFGLGAANIKERISLNKDASSFFVEGVGVSAQTVEVKDVVDFLTESHITWIDVLKINIEGGEFELLNRLLGSGHIKRIRHLQIQFHDFFPDARERREKIRRELSSTHVCDYCYEFVWEGWTLRHQAQPK